MADAFQPRFVDLVRNYTTTTGTSDFNLGPAVNGYADFIAALQVGDQFYYSAIGVDNPAEREVGRGTLLAGGKIGRDPIDGVKTSFTNGTKAIALIAPAEWFSAVHSAANASTTSVTDRAALASMAPRQSAVMLCEAGREGLFLFDPADLSSKVGADASQGLFVAPSADPTGASGAWVRQFKGPALSTWWGVSTDAAPDVNGAAMDAALAALKALAIFQGYNAGSIGLHTPAGVYQFDRPITPEHALEISGDFTGNASGGGTVFEFTANTSGFKLQGWDGFDRHATGASIRGFILYGVMDNVEGEAHGIETTTKVTVRDFLILGFTGDGINCCGNYATNKGNCNGSLFENGLIQECRRGTYTDGGDANNITFLHVSCIANRKSGHQDSSFLGCNYSGGDCSGNGLTWGFPTRCSSGGKIYAVRMNQEAWCASNPPSGTTEHNTGWIYRGIGDPNDSAPAWAANMTWHFSAPFCNDNVNQWSTFKGIYVEFDQNPCILTGHAVVIPGTQLVRVLGLSDGLGFGGFISGQEVELYTGRNLHTGGNIQVDGFNSYLGPQADPGFLQDAQLQIRSWNEYCTISFYRQGVYRGQIKNGLGQIFYDVDLHNFRKVDGTPMAALAAGGYDLKTGGYKIGGTSVIDAARNGSFTAVTATAGLTTSGGVIGYATGAGNAQVQPTSKSTTVTINKVCGKVTTNAAALAAGDIVEFIVNNVLVTASDTIILNAASGAASSTAYRYWVSSVAAGSFKICLENRSGSALSEALAFNYAILKAVNA